MLSFSFNAHNILSIFLVVILHVQPCVIARPKPAALMTKTKNNNNDSNNSYHYTWQNFLRFINAKRGSHINGMSELKKYFHHFGYLPIRDFQNITDSFDAHFEAAVGRYQSKFGLHVTGWLDNDTLTQIMSPRCGVSDASIHALHASRNYVYFPGKPRWARMSLTYAFSPENLIHYISFRDLKGVFRRAFGHWESVIPLTFIETLDYEFADIKIGFYKGDHGDGEAFDGVLGVLAHSFSPESGRFHLDAAETWAVDFDVEKSKVAVDLESVAVHEIGHLLGLGHSSVKEAVMYPSLKPRRKKVELSVDDIQGVQALYGSNPNFTFASLLEFDISSNHAVDFRTISNSHIWVTIIFVVTNFILGFCF